MATYKEIIAYVKANYGFVPQDCWIAHAKAAGRNGPIVNDGVDIGTPTKPCSEQKRLALLKALRELGVI